MAPTTMWVVEWTPVRPWAEIAPHLPDHLTYLGDLEARGRVFASGPFPGDDGTPDGRGMTVLRVGSADEAQALAAGDPLAAAGLRRFTLRRWSVVEGGVTVTIRYSDGTFTLGDAAGGDAAGGDPAGAPVPRHAAAEHGGGGR